MQRVPRNTSKLTVSLHRQLASYAVAASAAGVGMLALAPPAGAKVIYTPVSLTIGPNGTYPLDLNRDGVADFQIANYYLCNTEVCTGKLNAYPAANNGVEGVKGIRSTPLAYALPRGSRIGPKVPLSGQLMAEGGSVAGLGQWIDVSDRYLGLKFAVNGQIHYGWARLSATVAEQKLAITAILTGYAYETVPGKPIIAGKTKGPDVVTVQPGTLGRLTRGASAIAIRRKSGGNE